MAEITEEELQKQIADEPETELTGLAADLQAEITADEQEPKEEPVADEPKDEQPAEEETPKDDTPAEEPETKEEPAEQEPVEEEPAKLILGKFKSQEDLEKAYQNLEKKMGRLLPYEGPSS